MEGYRNFSGNRNSVVVSSNPSSLPQRHLCGFLSLFISVFLFFMRQSTKSLEGVSELIQPFMVLMLLCTELTACITNSTIPRKLS